MYHDIRINIDFLDDLQELEINSGKWPNVETALLRLKYVDAAWIDHMCIVEANFETSRFDTAQRRAILLKQKIRRVLERYAPKRQRQTCAQAHNQEG